MAITKLKSGLFNTNSYTEPDRRYDSKDFVDMASFTHNGYITGRDNEVSVTNPVGLTINVNKGIYNIDGHYIDNDTAKTFSLTPTQAGKERYDIIVIGVTRDSSRTIDGTLVSREGYVRVIEGNQADLGKGIVPSNLLIIEDFEVSSGTKEIKLAIAKVVSGSIETLLDKRVSTSTDEIKSYITKEIINKEENPEEDPNYVIDMTEYNLQTTSDISEFGAIISGTASDLINKEIEILYKEEVELESLSVWITINGAITKLNVLKGKEDFNFNNTLFNVGDNFLRFSFVRSGDKLELKYNPILFEGLDISIHMTTEELIVSVSTPTVVKEDILDKATTFLLKEIIIPRTEVEASPTWGSIEWNKIVGAYSGTYSNIQGHSNVSIRMNEKNELIIFGNYYNLDGIGVPINRESFLIIIGNKSNFYGSHQAGPFDNYFNGKGNICWIGDKKLFYFGQKGIFNADVSNVYDFETDTVTDIGKERIGTEVIYRAVPFNIGKYFYFVSQKIGKNNLGLIKYNSETKNWFSKTNVFGDWRRGNQFIISGSSKTVVIAKEVEGSHAGRIDDLFSIESNNSDTIEERKGFDFKIIGLEKNSPIRQNRFLKSFEHRKEE